MTHLSLAQQAALIHLALGQEECSNEYLVNLQPHPKETPYPEWKGTTSIDKFTAKIEPYGNPPAYNIYINFATRGISLYKSEDLLKPFLPQDATPWIEALEIYKKIITAESTLQKVFQELREEIIGNTTPADIPWKILAQLNTDDAIHACADQENVKLPEAENLVRNYLNPPKPPTHAELLQQYVKYLESYALQEHEKLESPMSFNQWKSCR